MTDKTKALDARIMIVSDDNSMRDILKAHATRLGHAPMVMARKDATPESLAKQVFDLILMDVSDLSEAGMTILRQIRTTEELRRIPMIAITNVDDHRLVGDCMRLGVQSCIGSPVNITVLRSRIADVFVEKCKMALQTTSSRLSLASAGTWTQFALAVFLISILPTLALVFLLVSPEHTPALSDATVRVVLAVDILLMASGYALLIKYPINVTRLRRYLEMLAKGTLPKRVDLVKEENDLDAIEKHMSSIISQTEDRLLTIEEQTKALVEAERQRVMLESLGAACHHLGQPATIIDLYLAMMSENERSPELLDMIKRCQESSQQIASILRKLQTITQYRTEAYRPREENKPPRPDERIIKI